MPAFDVNIGVYEQGRKRPDYSLAGDLAGEFTLKDLLEYTKAALIIIADQVLTEEQALGFDKEPVLTVDGSSSKRIQDVSPLGKIEFTSRADISDIVLDTMNALITRSKIDTGLYVSSHYVFLNGRQVATNLASLEGWLQGNPTLQDKDVIRFVNIQPYARKLERYGITAQRSKVRRVPGKKRGKPTGNLVFVPNGTYALTARAIRSKYKRNTTVAFNFLPGSTLGLTGSFKGGRSGKNSGGRPYLYPSITISVSERGTT